jgi:hypothetical protein
VVRNAHPSFKNQLKKKLWVDGVAFDSEQECLMDAWGNSRPYSVSSPPLHRTPAAARTTHTDLPRGAKIVCDKTMCLNIRYDRVVAATWRHGGYQYGVPKQKKGQNNSFGIKPTRDIVLVDGATRKVEKGKSLAGRRIRDGRLQIMEDVLQLQVDHRGRLPSNSRSDQQEYNSCKRVD